MSYEVGARERSLCESGVSDLVFVLVPYTILSCCQLQRVGARIVSCDIAILIVY